MIERNGVWGGGIWSEGEGLAKEKIGGSIWAGEMVVECEIVVAGLENKRVCFGCIVVQGVFSLFQESLYSGCPRFKLYSLLFNNENDLYLLIGGVFLLTGWLVSHSAMMLPVAGLSNRPLRV
jgi:hypothetical protein